nr:hypothetical protein [Asticcacaulis biprosthecium]
MAAFMRSGPAAKKQVAQGLAAFGPQHDLDGHGFAAVQQAQKATAHGDQGLTHRHTVQLFEQDVRYELVALVADDGREKFLFAGKALVQGQLGHTDGARHRVHGGALIAVVEEQFAGDLQDLGDQSLVDRAAALCWRLARRGRGILHNCHNLGT